MCKYLPAEIINDILLNYIPIHYNKCVTTYIENERTYIIKSSIAKIRKVLYKYILKRRYEILYYHETYFLQPISFKHHYPICNRKKCLKEIVNRLNLIRYIEINTLYKEYLKNPKNKLTITFNKIIDLMNEHELNSIEW